MELASDDSRERALLNDAAVIRQDATLQLTVGALSRTDGSDAVSLADVTN